MIKIAIIGTGRIGTRLAEQIILDKYCDELYLWNRSKKRLRGTLVSLKIWSSIINSRTRVELLEWDKLQNYDIIVISIKEKYDPREILKEHSQPNWLPKDLRYVGLLKDYPLLKDICFQLRKYKGKVVIITNPIEIMTYFASKWLKDSNVYGLGLSLDTARFAYILSSKKRRRIDFDDPILGGEHGRRIVPLKSLWKDDYNVSKSELSGYISKVQSLGYKIVNYLGFSLQDCAAVFSKDIEWLLGMNKKRMYSVLSLFYKNTCIGLPTRLDEAGTVENLIELLSKREIKYIESVRIMLLKLTIKIENKLNQLIY